MMDINVCKTETFNISLLFSAGLESLLTLNLVFIFPANTEGNLQCTEQLKVNMAVNTDTGSSLIS